MFFLQLILLFLNAVVLLVSGVDIGTASNTCISSGLQCSAGQKCCPISNGKSYCNVKSGRCEVIRYCEESSSNKCPFDDLSSEELAQTVSIIRKSNSFSDKILFAYIRKQEPKKEAWNSGATSANERIAYAVLLDIKLNLLFEVLVSLTEQTIKSTKSSTQNKALLTSYEYEFGDQILRNDPRVTKAYERRGLNASYASFDLWAYGASGNVNGKLRLKALLNYQDPATKYMDWRPIEGLEATIDLVEGKIVDFIDASNVPLPKAPILSESVETASTPSGTSIDSAIKVNGYIINWKNWKFQYSMDPVHGLQLFHIRYTGDCEERFLIYKLSISEMYVPYGATGKTWRWRGAFDAGEYGLGKSVSPLTLGTDVPNDATLLPCPILNDQTGEVSEMKECIALYERGAGSWYKHYDSDSNTEDAKTAGDMVAAFMCTVGNYDYMFEYVFKFDGNIHVGIYATGILLGRAVPQVKNDPNCIEKCQDFINENMVAPPHQHFFNYRIDFDIEGTNNILTELDLVNEPISLSNLDGGAFSLRRSIIRRETYREHSPENARVWSVINPQSRNKYNSPRGYAIHPTSIGFTYLKAGNPLNQAMFIKHPIWVTKYKDEEQAAAGDFPRSGRYNQGLPEYIRDLESLENSDLVLWHTLAIGTSS